MRFLETGHIVGTHGIKGEVKVLPITDNLSRFNINNVLYLGDKKEKILIDTVRKNKNMILISFNGHTNINEVLYSIGQVLYFNGEEDESDGYFYDDLIDCKIMVNDEQIGIVIDVMEVPQGEILQIKKNDKKIVLVPFVDEFVKEVDIDKKIIIISPIEDLL